MTALSRFGLNEIKYEVAADWRSWWLKRHSQIMCSTVEDKTNDSHHTDTHTHTHINN